MICFSQRFSRNKLFHSIVLSLFLNSKVSEITKRQKENHQAESKNRTRVPLARHLSLLSQLFKADGMTASCLNFHRYLYRHISHELITEVHTLYMHW